MSTLELSRRELLAGVAATPGVAGLAGQGHAAGADPSAHMDLTGAKWIWLPCQRTLPCTFVLFRHVSDLPGRPEREKLWIAADSRYKLSVNGHRVQWGPAPCDPRWLDVDPADVAAFLQPGRNVIGVEVLFYGVGDGTWPAGKPGLLVRSDFEMSDGRHVTVATDESWLAFLDRAHPPGQYKRWFLRALQEQFDARSHPYGWNTVGFVPDARWMKAAVLQCPPDKPPASAPGPYSGDSIDRADPVKSHVREREIPPVRESDEPALKLAESGRVRWLRDPEDWFQCRIPGSFELDRTPVARARGPREWELPDSSYAILEFPIQMVGFPKFTIEASAGTVVEAMPQESHDPAKTAWLDTHHFGWSRFICREGINEFECFDYESLRVQPILDDFRRRWATMRSVTDNLTIQENWHAASDSTAQWSHSGVAPLYCAHMSLAGIRPLKPGFQRVVIRPQLGDLPDLELTTHTPRGPIEFQAERRGAGLVVKVVLPDGCTGEFSAPGKRPASFTGSREFNI